MIEKIYPYSTEDAKKIEKLIDDDPVNINHIVLPKGEKVPDHRANSYVHMIVVRGTLTLVLGEQEAHHYSRGNVVHIPFDTPMKVSNQGDEVCEFFVVKTPTPRLYGK